MMSRRRKLKSRFKANRKHDTKAQSTKRARRRRRKTPTGGKSGNRADTRAEDSEIRSRSRNRAQSIADPPPARPRKWYTQKTLIEERGWNLRLIKLFGLKPRKLLKNFKNPRFARTKIYDLKSILKIEETRIFKKEMNRTRNRSYRMKAAAAARRKRDGQQQDPV